MIPEEEITAIMKILSEWNPLGKKANNVHDLDGYRTEAIDLLFWLELVDSKSEAIDLVQRLIKGAFDLSLSRKECKEVGQKIWKFRRKQTQRL